MVDLILETKLDLDTEWCKRMIILCLKILNLGHLRNSVSSLLLYKPIRICAVMQNKSVLNMNEKEKDKK